jgi:hypothetical protein
MEVSKAGAESGAVAGAGAAAALPLLFIVPKEDIPENRKLRIGDPPITTSERA